jgi:hypothetical protein
MENRYVVLRMSTGEELIAVLHAEDSDSVMVMHPMEMHHAPDEEHGIEHYWAQPFCPYSEEQTFFLEKKHIVYIKRLSEYLVPHYHSMVQNFSESEVIKSARMSAERKVSWGGKEITEEEAKQRIEQIKKLRELDSLDDEDTIH